MVETAKTILCCKYVQHRNMAAVATALQISDIASGQLEVHPRCSILSFKPAGSTDGSSDC